MNKGNFRQAIGKNEPVTAMIEMDGTVYVSTETSIYKFRHSGDNEHELTEVEFYYEGTAI